MWRRRGRIRTRDDNNNIGIDFAGFEDTCSNPARDGACRGNVVWNIRGKGNPSYSGEASADGIYYDGAKVVIIPKFVKAAMRNFRLATDSQPSMRAPLPFVACAGELDIQGPTRVTGTRVADIGRISGLGNLRSVWHPKLDG